MKEKQQQPDVDRKEIQHKNDKKGNEWMRTQHARKLFDFFLLLLIKPLVFTIYIYKTTMTKFPPVPFSPAPSSTYIPIHPPSFTLSVFVFMCNFSHTPFGTYAKIFTYIHAPTHIHTHTHFTTSHTPRSDSKAPPSAHRRGYRPRRPVSPCSLPASVAFATVKSPPCSGRRAC